MADAAHLHQQGFTDEEVLRILNRATRMQQRSQAGTEPGILRESAAQVGVRPEFVDRAIQDLRAEQARRSRVRTVAIAVAAAAVLVVALFLAGAYNALNSRLIAVQQARAQLENVLQRRYDLIPNLVAVTREVAGQERAVFTTLAQARTRYYAADTLQEKEAVERDVRAALPDFYAVAENYPQLRSSEAYTRLQDELAGTENRIAVERRRYNEAVAAYNGAARSFPLTLARGVLGFPAEQPFFAAQPEAQRAPRVGVME